jgi:hypothetical protein
LARIGTGKPALEAVLFAIFSRLSEHRFRRLELGFDITNCLYVFDVIHKTIAKYLVSLSVACEPSAIDTLLKAAKTSVELPTLRSLTLHCQTEHASQSSTFQLTSGISTLQRIQLIGSAHQRMANIQLCDTFRLAEKLRVLDLSGIEKLTSKEQLEVFKPFVNLKRFRLPCDRSIKRADIFNVLGDELGAAVERIWIVPQHHARQSVGVPIVSVSGYSSLPDLSRFSKAQG